MKEPEVIELDGRTGEGGGQLVRLAVSLAAVTTQPVRITHVRGNREGSRGGGLKAQHVASITWLVAATDALATGLFAGSRTLTIHPRRPPSSGLLRGGGGSGGPILITAATAAASATLLLQAVLPFVLFAGDGGGGGGELELLLDGGTNVAWSPSYEYVDQVLLPALERWFGLRVGRELVRRGWNGGDRGRIRVTVPPLPPGRALALTEEAGRRLGDADREARAVDVSVLAPERILRALKDAVCRELEVRLPGAEVGVEVSEDSGSDARVYVLLVARSETLRWGRDVLTSMPRKVRGEAQATADFVDGVAGKVSRDLCKELRAGGVVDEFLQDQLVVFQALAEGVSSFPRDGSRGRTEEGMAGLGEAMRELAVGERRRDETSVPFGRGSAHTTTARWVTAELLPKVAWYNAGSVCEGAGFRTDPPA